MCWHNWIFVVVDVLTGTELYRSAWCRRTCPRTLVCPLHPCSRGWLSGMLPRCVHWPRTLCHSLHCSLVLPRKTEVQYPVSSAFGVMLEKEAAAFGVISEKEAAAFGVISEKEAAVFGVISEKEAAVFGVISEKEAAVLGVILEKEAAAFGVISEKEAAAFGVIWEKAAAFSKCALEDPNT